MVSSVLILCIILLIIIIRLNKHSLSLSDYFSVVCSSSSSSSKMATLTLEDYHNPTKPYSYASRNTVHAANPGKKKADVAKVLHQSQVYTKYRQYKRPRQFLPIYVHEKREQFQMDIIYMTGPPVKGYKFVLSIIDCYTKFAWCYPLKRISGQGVVLCLRRLFSNPNNIPRKVHTDRGVGKFSGASARALVRAVVLPSLLV